MGTSMRNPKGILAFSSVMAVSTPEGSVVQFSTTDDYTVILPSGAAPTTPLVGLLYQTAHATVANSPVEIVTEGVFPGIAGATITSGDPLTSNGTDGTVKPAAAGAGTNEAIIGFALEDALATERVSMLINPYVRQG